MSTKNLEKLAWGLGALVAVMTAFLVITSCNSEAIYDLAGNKQGTVPVRITAEITPAATRSVSTNLHETSFVQGDQILVCVGSEVGTQHIIDATKVCVFSDNNGNLQDPVVYDIGPNAISRIMGFYPHDINISGGTYEGATITHTVSLNQSSDLEYNKSDVMITDCLPATDVTYEKPTTTLTFKHRLSKVIVELVSANNLDMSSYIVDIQAKPTAEFADVATPGVVTASGTAQYIKLKDADNTSTTVCGIIPPQTITAGTDLFKVTYNGTEHTASLKNDITFKSGYSHKFVVKVYEWGNIEVTSVSITGWIPDDTDTDVEIW